MHHDWVPFIPDYSQWVSDRMIYVPRETLSVCGSLTGLRILNVGCGDMLADFGLLSLGPVHITGLDVHHRAWDVVEHAATEIRKFGYPEPEDYRNRLTYLAYDGTRFPFPAAHFDLVICWGSFEHIANVPAVLAEMRRVLTPAGRIFVVVYPWFHTFTGSHLSDFIPVPFFHLSQPEDWVYGKLEEYLAANPDVAAQHLDFFGPEGCPMPQFILDIMWTEYRHLNKYSARQFLAAAMEAGLMIEQLKSHMDPARPDAPASLNPVDIYTSGTTVVFRPAPGIPPLLPDELAQTRAALTAETQLRKELQNSISWKLTAPGRAAVGVFQQWRKR